MPTPSADNTVEQSSPAATCGFGAGDQGPLQPVRYDLAMFCKGCRYNLRGLAVDRCPECGREFDLSDGRTFDQFDRGFRRYLRDGCGSRALIAFSVLFLWSLVILGDPGFDRAIISGPFVLVLVWDWWPWNAVAAAVGVCVLTPMLLWVATERTAFLGLTIVASLLSIPFSFIVMLKMALLT